MQHRTTRGFTLIELMMVVAIVAILGAVALPAYGWYMQRSRVPAALEVLSSTYTRLELRYQDAGRYDAATVCAVAMPAAPNFTVSCAVLSGGQGFRLTATGSGTMAGFGYTIDHQGLRRTTAHPKGLPATDCWTTRGRTCDT